MPVLTTEYRFANVGQSEVIVGSVSARQVQIHETNLAKNYSEPTFITLPNNMHMNIPSEILHDTLINVWHIED